MPVLAELKRFFRTPKGLLIIILAVLAGLGMTTERPAAALRALAICCISAGLTDMLIFLLLGKGLQFPSGAVLSGFFIAMVLSPGQHWYIFAVSAEIAIVSKYVFRTRSANVFNPAALAIVASFYIFGSPQNWWGGLAEASPILLLVVFGGALFIIDRVNKLPLVLVFLGCYFALFSFTAFGPDSARVAEIFRAPDLQAVLFFAFFFLTDPPTSPVSYGGQAGYAVIVAVASYAIFQYLGAVCYLVAGLLVANVWEAWRRYSMSTRRLSVPDFSAGIR